MNSHNDVDSYDVWIRILAWIHMSCMNSHNKWIHRIVWIHIMSRQPYRLKISFEGGSKDIKIRLESYKPNYLDFMFFWNAMCSVHSMATWTTRHIAPNQAWFEPEYFLALTEDGPPLFSHIGQCFQDVSLTEWNKVVGKQCLDDNDLTKASFKKWTRDYQRQSPGCPT